MGNGMCYVKDKGNEKDKNKMAGKNDKGKDKGKYLPAGLEMKMEAMKKTREAASQR